MTARDLIKLVAMLVEVSGDELHFQVISRTGSAVDAGMIQKRSKSFRCAELDDRRRFQVPDIS
jgi:hypothetical protein